MAAAALLYTANKHISINFNDDLKNKLTQHNHLINTFLPIHDTIKYGLPLFKHNIIYLDQITSENSDKLLTCKQVIDITTPNDEQRLSPRKPIFYKKLKQVIIENNSNRQIHRYLFTNNFTDKPLSLFFQNRIIHSKKLVAIWNSANSSPIYGEIIDQPNNNHVILQHLIPNNPRNKNSNHLRKCNGCSHNNIFVKQHIKLVNPRNKANCSLINNIDDIVTIKADSGKSGS